MVQTLNKLSVKSGFENICYTKFKFLQKMNSFLVESLAVRELCLQKIHNLLINEIKILS